MKQQVDSPPDSPDQQAIHRKVSSHENHSSRTGIISLLVIIGMLLLLFSGLLIHNLPQAIKTPVPTRTVQPTATSSSDLLVLPGKTSDSLLQVPSGRTLLYEDQKNIYLISLDEGTSEILYTPGYIYNRAIPPLLLSSGELLYAGDGIWLTDIQSQNVRRLAVVPANQVITSLVISKDEKTVAWSTEPKNGVGMLSLYAGLLSDPNQLIYEQSALQCPCFRVFSFFSTTGAMQSNTLLLTDDLGDHHDVQYGLWTLRLNQNGAVPHPLLDEDVQQSPLLLSSSTGVLLYSTYVGVVPPPVDSLVPDDVAGLNYANSLYTASIDRNTLLVRSAQVLLPEQQNLSNSAAYHWVTTPTFSPNGRTLVYVVFSSDTDSPYDRHSAIYTVQMSGSQLATGKPKLLATSNAHFIELGSWLNDHILTCYADGSVYAFDVLTGSFTELVQTGHYTRIVAVMEQK